MAGEKNHIVSNVIKKNNSGGDLQAVDAIIVPAGKLDSVYGKTLSFHGKMVGNFAKDKYSSDLTNIFNSAVKEAKLETRDISNAFSDLLAVKDSVELDTLKKASNVTSNVFNKCLKEEIMDIIDSDKRVKHTKLSTLCQSALKKTNLLNGLDANAMEMCYDPIIQSGGKFNLRFSVESDDQHLHFGVIICSLGVRYQCYCSNIIRTLMVNPTEEQSAVYAYLNDLLDWAIEKVKPDLKISEFCQSIHSKVKTDRPDLADKLVRSFGFVTGIEFRDSNQVLSEKNTGVFRDNMTLNLNIGLQNLSNPKADNAKDKQYALWLGDVICVGQGDDGTNLVYTTAAKRRPKAVSLYIQDEEDNDDDEENNEEEEADDDNAGKKSDKKKSASGSRNRPTDSKKKRSRSSANGTDADHASSSMSNGNDEVLGRGHRRAILQQKTRSEQNAEEKRMSNRRDLFNSLVKSSTDRLSGLKTDSGLDTKAKSTVAYKGAGQMPKEDDIQRLRLFVDKKYETIILPIFGMPTPFHISTIKNVSTSIEADFTYLRINFHHPGAVVGVKDVSGYQTPEATYVKEMTYRASNLRRHNEVTIPATNLNNTYRIIKEVLKRYRSREAEERERANLVEQDQLVVDHVKGNFRLKDLYIRPNLTQKRITGTLETHSNGFRFTSIRGDQVDILYNNIRHAFYQPCDGEMIILIHFHLKNAIMYGKKKQQDVQFYTEVGELITDLSKAHSRMADRDDLEAEQRERDMREQIKSAFRAFVDKTEGLARRYDLEFETPFRDLGFFGCPHRSTVFLMPTSSALMSVTELPPFVVTLEEVEFVMLERVSLSIRTFDMVFVFKDYKRKPAMINSIPSTSLELVKEWMISCDIYYAEGTKSLNWPKLMKTVLDNPEGFIEEGGWSFISPEEDDDEEEENSEIEDENYAPSENDLEDDGDEESDASGGGDGGSDEEEDWEAEEQSDDPESFDSDESEGKDWDQLEEEAKREDAKILEEFEDPRQQNKRRHVSPEPQKKSKKPKHR